MSKSLGDKLRDLADDVEGHIAISPIYIQSLAFEADSLKEQDSKPTVIAEEPTESGWYAYSGGAQSMIFHRRKNGQWSAHFENGSASDCAWGYIEQALGVWDLVRIPLGMDEPMPEYHSGGSLEVGEQY